MKTIIRFSVGAALAATAAGSALAQPIRNVVLVRGAFADGSGWKPVYDRLVSEGYHVAIVEEPETSLEADVAATRRATDLRGRARWTQLTSSSPRHAGPRYPVPRQISPLASTSGNSAVFGFPIEVLIATTTSSNGLVEITVNRSVSIFLIIWTPFASSHAQQICGLQI